MTVLSNCAASRGWAKIRTTLVELRIPPLSPSEQEPSETAKRVPTPAGEALSTAPSREIGGRGGLDPTRYGDWEKDGRCIDF
jgi:hypothetical protein